MKNKLLLPLFLVVGISFYISCRKNSNYKEVSSKSNTDNDLIMAAKNYFENNVRLNTIEGAQKINGTHAALFNHIASLIKTGQWNLCSIVQLSKVKVVVIPLFFQDSLSGKSNISNGAGKMPINSISRLLIYRGVSGAYNAVVMSTYPDSNYLNTNSNFSGITTIQTWQGNYIKGLKFENNKKIYNLSWSDSAASTGSVQTNDFQMYETTCYYNDWYNCGANGCTYDYTEELGCETSEIGSGGGDEDVSVNDYEVLASGDPTVQQQVDTIKNLIVLPCMKAILAQMISGACQSEIASILVNTFQTSNTLNVTFKSLLSGSTADASTSGNINNTTGVVSITVTLNTKNLTNASPQFIAETIFHEIIHAYLDVNSSLEPVMEQHCEMITSYVDCEQAALCADFPGLSAHDALCMIIGGMGTVQQYDAATLATVEAAYSLTNSDIVATYNAYKNGEYGTCNLN